MSTIAFLNQTYYNNSLLQLFLFVLILLIGIVFKRLITRLLSRLFFQLYQKYALDLTEKDLHILLKKPVGYFILLVFAYLSFNQLNFPAFLNLEPKENFGLRMLLERAYFVAFIFSLMHVFRKLFDFMGIIMLKNAEAKDSKSEKQLIPFAVETLKLAIVIFGLFIILGSVFKINVGTLIAGLGIGGLAIALAAKESIENLMGSFTIFMDKPFATGDMVKIGNTQGVVEKVGFRSTRLRSLDKTFITVPNKNMVNSEVDNLTERSTRRVSFNLGLRYDSKIEHIKNIINDITVYINAHENTTEECTVKFAEFDNSSLNIMVLYFVNINDFNIFVNTREDINFKIMEIVHQNQCDFAFPSRSIYMEK